MTDYVQQEATPNLLLQEILDHIRVYQNGSSTPDAALAELWVVASKFLELHKYLKGGGQFPREWVTRRNQYSPDEWRARS